MRVLVRSYDIRESTGGGAFLRLLADGLSAKGHQVWLADQTLNAARVKAWSADVVVAQHWAIKEATQWATEVRLPLVVIVHGTGQYEHFMPQCDLVIFRSASLRDSLSDLLGQTPVMIAQDPVDNLAVVEENLARVAANGRRRPTLALCMTVSNEAATLERAIDSVASHVDEIVVGVDARSTDQTVEIARRRATHVFEYSESSPPDFRRMRNRSLERATTDWVVVLDGHEWVENADLIRPALETTAWSIEVETLFEPDESGLPGLIFPFARIHRRHVRFTGTSVHEEVSTPMDWRCSCRGIKFWHERKPGRASECRSVEKSHAELEVLRASWNERGDRRALFYLANGLRESGKHEEAVSAYHGYLTSPNFEEEGWQALLYLGRSYAALRDFTSARHMFEQALLKYPERAEPAVALGHVLLEMRQPRAAAAWFRHAASLPVPDYFRLFVEVPAYKWQAWHGLALAQYSQNDFAAAAEAEHQALLHGAGEWARQNLDSWNARAAAVVA